MSTNGHALFILLVLLSGGIFAVVYIIFIYRVIVRAKIIGADLVKSALAYEQHPDKPSMRILIAGDSTRVSTTTTPRLLGQRTRRPIACGRRGARSSHSAISARTPAKALMRINGSAAKMVSDTACTL